MLKNQKLSVRRKTSASVRWSGDPCVFCKTNISSTKAYSKKTHTVISSQRNGNININEVGYMTRNQMAGVSAHYNCLLFTPGVDMVQDLQGSPVSSLEQFQVDLIEQCVEKYSKKKCCHCHKPGAVAECANKRCKKTGWYHFPCGLKNGAVQKEIHKKEGPTVETYCFKCGSGGKRKSNQKKVEEKGIGIRSRKRKVNPIVIRKISEDQETGEPIWVTTSDSQPSSQSSMSSQIQDDTDHHNASFAENTLSQETFDNSINFKLKPIDLNYLQQDLYEKEVYIDNAEEDEEVIQEDSVTNDYLDTLTEVDISSGFSELTPEEEELFLSEDSSG